MYRLLMLLFFSTLIYAQAKPPAPPKAAAPAKQSQPPAPAADEAPKPKTEVPPTAPVITIDGVCDGKVPATPNPGCKTVITRAQFEKLVDALDPKMPAPRRQQLAEIYSRMLVMSDAAEQRGIANAPATREVLQFMRMQTLGQLLIRDLQKQAAEVPPAATEKYYNEHAPQYEQATFERIFLPKNPAGGEKPADEKTLQAEAAKIRAAAASGGDFAKLQKQAYDDLGMKTPPPPTEAGTQRRESMPPSQAKVFDLQPGQISEVLSEPGGLYIFKLVSKKKLTLPEVSAEINRTLEQERMKDEVDKLTKNVKTDLNPEFFGGAGGEGEEHRSRATPPAATQPPTPKPQTTPPTK